MVDDKGVLRAFLVIVVVGLLGAGYLCLTSGGDYSDTYDMRQLETTGNITHFDYSEDGLELTYKVGNRIYSTEGAEGSYPVVEENADNETVGDRTRLDNDGSFSGDYFQEDLEMVEKVNGVINVDHVYLSIERVDRDDGRFPYMAECSVVDNTVISDYHPSVARYLAVIILMSLVCLCGVFVFIDVFLRKKA